MTTSFDPVRREELRIMGFGDVYSQGETDHEMMAKTVAHDGPIDVSAGRVEAMQGDLIVEAADGVIEHLTAAEWDMLGYVLLPPETTAPSDEPVPLAVPVGLLQRDDAEEPNAPQGS